MGDSVWCRGRGWGNDTDLPRGKSRQKTLLQLLSKGQEKLGMLQDSLRRRKQLQRAPPAPVLALLSPATGTTAKGAEHSWLQGLL